MKCQFCGMENEESAVFCASCGAQMEIRAQAAPAPAPVPVVQPQSSLQPDRSAVIPESHKPLSPWAYVGYQLLFSIPLVGFILLIVFSLQSDGNINRRNFARSYWCAALIGVVFAVIVVILAIAFGSSLAALVESGMYY